MTGLLMATLLEAEPFITALSLRHYDDHSFPVYGNERYVLIISGIGKAYAASACTYLNITFRPSQVFNLGAAGSVNDAYPLGSIFHISTIIELDRLTLESEEPYVHTPDILKGHSTASLATQDRPIRNPEDYKAIGRYAQLIDMEGAAVIQMCRFFQTRCYLFKYISDTPDNRNIRDAIMMHRSSFCRFVCRKLFSS